MALRKKRIKTANIPLAHDDYFSAIDGFRRYTNMKLATQLLLLFFVPLLFVSCGGTYEPTDTEGKARCYQMEFGVLPPLEVTNLQGKQMIIGDAVTAWLRFEATPALVDTLLKGFTPSDRQTFDQHTGSAHNPVWWAPEQDRITTFHFIEGWRKDLSPSSAVLAYDADKRVVYFCHYGGLD